QLQGGEVRERERQRDRAPARKGDRRDPLRSGRRYQDRTAGEAARARLAVRAARQVGDAARRQLPLRDRGRHAHRARGGALRHRDLALGVQFRVRPVRQARRIPKRSRAVREICRGRAIIDAPGLRGARVTERCAEHRARRQAGAAHRQAEGFEPSGDRRAGRAGRPAHRGEPQEGGGGVTMKYAVLILVLCGLAHSAAAQTAEETALFLTLGLEDGLKDKDGKTVVRQVNKNTWEIVEGPEKGNFEVVQINPCKYRFVLLEGAALEIDFNKVREFKVTGSQRDATLIQISGPEIMVSTKGGQTKSMDTFAQRVDASPDRYNKAIAYFRSSFCKGRAF